MVDGLTAHIQTIEHLSMTEVIMENRTDLVVGIILMVVLEIGSGWACAHSFDAGAEMV